MRGSYGGSISHDKWLSSFANHSSRPDGDSTNDSFRDRGPSGVDGIELPADFLFAQDWNTEDLLQKVRNLLEYCSNNSPAFLTAFQPVSYQGQKRAK